MSIGSALAALFGCDNCQRMHRRAQAAESAATKAESRAQPSNSHEVLHRVLSVRWQCGRAARCPHYEGSHNNRCMLDIDHGHKHVFARPR